ncbi:MAG: MFS transporter [Ruminococcaceae bacterium]|nr:MFS transporter [Oscillospiraceae bacterium]
MIMASLAHKIQQEKTMRKSTPHFSLKHRLSDFAAVATDVLVDNSDGNVSGRRAIISYTFLASIVAAIVGGHYYTGVLLELGATETYIATMNMVITFCGFLQFLSPLLLEKIKKRKAILIASRLLYHILYVLVFALIPLLPIGQLYKIVGFFAVNVIVNIITSLTTSGMSIWHMQSIPLAKQSNYFAITNLGNTLLNVIVTFVTARYVDSMQTSGSSVLGMTPLTSAFIILRAVGLVFALLELFFLVRIKEYPYEIDKNESNNRGLRLLLSPIANKKFMLTISIQLAWWFVSGLIGSYFSVYLIDEINMSYTYLSLGGIISTPLIMVSTPLWAVIIKKIGWRNTYIATAIGYAVAYAGNAFVTKSSQYMYIVVLVICYIFSSTGILQSLVVYLNMPDYNRTAYLSFYSLCTTLTTLLGNFVGMVFMNLTESITINFLGIAMGNNQYMGIVQGILSVGVAVYAAIVGKIVSKN